MIETERDSVNERRQELLDSLESQAEWRDRKAVEYPDDRRNSNSAQALRQLATQLETIPVSDATWIQYANGWDALDDDQLMRAMEDEREELRTYGFTSWPSEVSPEDAAAFLRDRVSVLENLPRSEDHAD
jgi:hypothetical protein